MFDPKQFLQRETTSSNSTEFLPTPAGVWPAAIKNVDATMMGKEGAKRPVLQVEYSIDSAEVREQMGRPEVTIKQNIFLDVNEDGALQNGKGQNVQLGRLRDAVGQNVDGQNWSPLMLIGQVVQIEVVHKAGDKGIMANVDAVAARS